MCEPRDMRRAPPSASAAMNSIPYVVARAVAHGSIDIGDFTAAARGDAATLAVAARIDHVLEAGLARPLGLEPGALAFVLQDGQRLAKRVDVPLGHPTRPLSDADVASKFRSNARFAVRPLSEARMDRLVACIEALPTLDDASALWGRLLPDAS
jgi:2-methylcitrate dehydratase PrpD